MIAVCLFVCVFVCCFLLVLFSCVLFISLVCVCVGVWVLCFFVVVYCDFVVLGGYLFLSFFCCCCCWGGGGGLCFLFGLVGSLYNTCHFLCFVSCFVSYRCLFPVPASV